MLPTMSRAARSPGSSLVTTPQLDAPPDSKRRHAVRWDCGVFKAAHVAWVTRSEKFAADWVLAREVEEVDAREDDEEAAD